MPTEPGDRETAEGAAEPAESEPRGYSIRVASHLTGIPAETLRMWERRYGFPAPSRAAGGLRLYSEDDVERLRLVARAQKAGYRVGEVIGRDRAELESTLGDLQQKRPEPPGHVPTREVLVDAIARDDLAVLRAELRRAALALGPRRFVTDLAGPLCTAVGDAWSMGVVAVRQEHLFASALSSQLRLLLAAYEDTERPPLVLLATLPGEQHALGIEMVAVYLAAMGATPRLAGPDLPPEQIADAARALSADVVGISVSVAADPRVTARHLRRLLRSLPRHCRAWVGGAGAAGMEAEVEGDAVMVVPTFADLDRALALARR